MNHAFKIFAIDIVYYFKSLSIPPERWVKNKYHNFEGKGVGSRVQIFLYFRLGTQEVREQTERINKVNGMDI